MGHRTFPMSLIAFCSIAIIFGLLTSQSFADPQEPTLEGLPEGPPVPMQYQPNTYLPKPYSSSNRQIAPAASTVLRLSPPPGKISDVAAPMANPIRQPDRQFYPAPGLSPSFKQFARPARPLNLIQAAVIEGDQLKIQMQRGSVAIVKSPFILQNPGRLVIDMTDAELGNANALFPAGQMNRVPIKAIRLGQFTEGTVRIVIETPEPENLKLAILGNTLAVSGESRSRGMVANLFGHLFGRSEPVSRRNQPNRPQRRTSEAPQMAQSQNGRPMAMSPGTYPANRYPELANLEKLSQTSADPSEFLQRRKIVQIAESQLGLSKDTQREYVVQAISRGKDESWCADFVSTVLDWAGGSPWGHLSRVQDIYVWGETNGRLSRQPLPAHVVVFGNFNHIALVESVSPDGTFTTIGGNEGYAAAAYKTSGSVSRSVYKVDDKRILGFVDPVFSSGSSPGNHSASVSSRSNL